MSGDKHPARRAWSSPMRRELALILGLFLLLLVLFQSDFSLRYASSVAGEWNYGSQDDSETISGSRMDSPLGSSRQPASSSPRAGMNELTLRWSKMSPVPQTRILQHAYGYNVFDNLYALNGTIYIVTDNSTAFPEIRTITSTGYPVFNSVEEVEKREPTDQDMKIISVEEASRLFGDVGSRIDGVTFMINDPPQFINHYYHFCAELLVGVWRAYASLDPGMQLSGGRTILPPPRRFVFTHTGGADWRDYAKMNQFVFHGAFPATAMEFKEDWEDRSATRQAWKFDRVVLADRAAAMRTHRFTDVERYAAPAFELPGSTNFWEPVRANVVEFAGEDRSSGGGTTNKPVITYVSRQNWGRRMLRPADHDRLVAALRRLERERGYELNIVEMDKLTRDEQIKLAARTTIMMGVHGNGLTSALWMNPTPRSAVMEFFYPQGFAADYEWTANAIGLNYFGWWGSQRFTSEERPERHLPEGFQGNDIPIDGDAVAALCVHQLSLVEEADD